MVAYAGEHNKSVVMSDMVGTRQRRHNHHVGDLKVLRRRPHRLRVGLSLVEEELKDQTWSRATILQKESTKTIWRESCLVLELVVGHTNGDTGVCFERYILTTLR